MTSDGRKFGQKETWREILLQKLKERKKGSSHKVTEILVIDIGIKRHRSSNYITKLKAVIERLNSPIGGESFTHIADYLIDGSCGVADPFMCLADFESYTHAYKCATSDYKNRMLWAQKSLIRTEFSPLTLFASYPKPHS